MLLRNELRAALLSEDKLDHHRQQADRQEDFCGWSYDVTEASLLQQDEVRAYMGRVVEGGTDDVSRPPSLRELTDRVDRLVNHVTQTNTDMMSQLIMCKDDVSSLKKTETDLQKKTTSLTDDVATIKKTESDLQSKTTSLTDDVATLKKTETDLPKKTTSLSDDVATLKKTETDLQKKTTSLSDDVATLKKTETDLQKKTTSLTDDVATLKKTETDLQRKTTSLSDDVATLKKTETDLQKKTTSLTDDVATMKKIEADLHRKTTSLTDDVATMKKTETDLQRKTTSLTDDVATVKKTKTTSLDTSVKDVLKRTTTLVNDVTLLKKREAETTEVNTAFKEKIGKAGRLVSFCVTNLDMSKTKEKEPMVFSKVKVNEGHCYDNTTGVFTAPVPGTYIFTAAVESGKKDRSVEAYIQVDGANYARIYGSYTSMGSSSVSVQLQAGQRVWVAAYSPPDDYLVGHNVPCFTGALVQPQV